MGCDIHAYAEYRDQDGDWRKVGDVFPVEDWYREHFGKDKSDAAFDWRHYGMYGFLADVRNYSAVPSLASPRGLPDDVSAEVRAEADDWGVDGHSHSWFSVKELTAFDYDQPIEDRRVTREISPGYRDGGCTAEPGGGEVTTWRQFLPSIYFRDLDLLAAIEAPEVRVVFWFDN